MEESGGCAPVVIGRSFGEKTFERRLGELVLSTWELQTQSCSFETVHTTNGWPLLLLPPFGLLPIPYRLLFPAANRSLCQV